MGRELEGQAKQREEQGQRPRGLELQEQGWGSWVVIDPGEMGVKELSSSWASSAGAWGGKPLRQGWVSSQLHHPPAL